MSDNPGLDLVEELKDFITHAFDFDGDGDLDGDDVKYAVKKVAATIYHVVKGTFEAIKPELIPLAAEAVMAATTATGDKRKAALQDVVQKLADSAVHAAVENGREEAAAIGDSIGVSGALVGSLVDSTYMALKAAGKIR